MGSLSSQFLEGEAGDWRDYCKFETSQVMFEVNLDYIPRSLLKTKTKPVKVATALLDH